MDSKYYDQIYRTSPYYRGPPEKSPYYILWTYVLGLIPPKSRILDVGCGPGQFAELCQARGHSYVGVDYSMEAISLAKARVPNVEFHLENVELDQSKIVQGNYDVVTFIEFAEHVQRDLLVLESVPKGKQAIVSVPSFPERGHVRSFPTLASAMERYSPLIEFDSLKTIPDVWNRSCRRYVLSGVRK